MATTGLVLGVVVPLACRKSAPPGPQTGTTSTASASAAPATARSGGSVVLPAPIASIAPLPSAIPVTPPASATPAACPAFSRALGRARAAMRAKRYPAAIQAYDQAVRARPFDAIPRAERGLVYLALEKPERAVVDLDFARFLTKDPTFLGQIYYNRAVVAQALGKPHDVRLALVLSARRGFELARTSLGVASSCPAIVTAQLGATGPIARNFRELAGKRVLACTDRSPAVGTEEEARQHVCRGCGYGDVDKGDQCQGPGPWSIDSGYMHFAGFTFFVAPLPGYGFFYSNSPSIEYRTEGGHLVVQEPTHSGLPLSTPDDGRFIRGNFLASPSDDPHINADNLWTDQEDPEGRPITGAIRVCQTANQAEVTLDDYRGSPTFPRLGPKETTAYSLRTKRERFAMAVYEGSVTVTLDAEQAHVRGETCDNDLQLPTDRP